MAFWSSQRLIGKINDLMSPPDPASVDCNAITLRIGAEIYITPNLNEVNSKTKQQLASGQPFLVPPGQFAFLMTEEIVSVPVDAMAFISMKATFKMKGLVNVSGFHVDPGWKGALIFAIFNAGPSPVHLQRGLPLFLIWYADLDSPSELYRLKEGPPTILPSLINDLSGGSDSIFELKEKLDKETKERQEKEIKLIDRLSLIEKAQAKLETIGTVIITLGIALLIFLANSLERQSVASHQDEATNRSSKVVGDSMAKGSPKAPEDGVSAENAAPTKSRSQVRSPAK